MALRDYQVPHFQRIYGTLVKNHSVLDASDTGTGKTYVALEVCKILGITPLVIGPKSARAGWEDAAKAVGVDIEFINYERVKPRLLSDGSGRRESEHAVEVPWGSGSFIKWKNAYGMVIFDEAHRCGGSRSLNSKLMIAAKRQAEYVMALSATAADDPRQMKALGFLLDLHGLGKKSRVMPNYMGWLLRHGVTPGVFGGYDFTEDVTKKNKAFGRLHHEIFPSRGARMVKNEIPGFPKTEILVKLLNDETGKAEGLAEELHELNGDGKSAMTEAMGIRQRLEKLKVPYFVDMAEDFALDSKVVVFVNFTEPLFEIYEKFQKIFGSEHVGYISGAQVGDKGDAERRRFLELFRANKLDALVCNSDAAGESASMHDPTGQVKRTTIISPGESGRRFKQVVGRVHRDGGAFSTQYVTGFANTYEEIVLNRLRQKNFNLDTLNDGVFLV